MFLMHFVSQSGYRGIKQSKNQLNRPGCWVLQAQFVSNCVNMIEKQNSETQEVIAGWFTPEQMKTSLHWSSCIGLC